ncbi:hypothetical protein Tco_1289365, partial [Tanacetum coccineum]
VDHISFREKPKVLLIAWGRFCEIKHTCGDKQQQELLRKLLKDVQNVKEELAEDINTPNWERPAFFYDDDDDDESSIPLRDIIMSELPPCIAITLILSIEEPADSLSMGDKHLSTIPEMELDKVIKSSVENLVPSPSESKDKSDGKCDLPLCDDSPRSNHVTSSNPLFDSNEDFTLSDNESFSEEDVPMENFKIFSNPLFDLDKEIISTKVNPICNEVLENISIDSSSKIDSLLDEFAGELTLLKSIPPRIDEAKFDSEGDTSLIERFLYDNSSLRPPKELNMENSIEFVPPSHIPVADSDPFMEEIDLFLASDGSIPPGIDSDYSDFEGDNLFLERLLHDDPIPLPDIPSPTLLTFPFEDHHDLDFTCVIRVFLPFFTYSVTSLFLLSSGSEDTIFDPDISNYHFSSLELGESHRCGTFMKFNVYPNLLNESPMKILSSTCSLMTN